MKFVIHIICILGIGLGSATTSSAQKDVSHYERGVEEIKQDQIRQALQLWLELRSKDSVRAFNDPRIGITFIKEVTENNYYKWYEEASTFYTSMFKNADLGDKAKYVRNEIDRLKPLIAKKRYQEWKNLLKSGNKRVMHEIWKLWSRMDPTPSTSYNERLMEHWERIAYAKAHFNYNASSPYGTDERGTVYVKYGTPFKVEEGIFEYSQGLVESWAREIMMVNPPSVPPGTMNRESKRGLPKDKNSNKRQIAQRLKEELFVDRITSYSRLYHSYPEYEIWIYRNLVKSQNKNVIFIFGREEGSGQFGLLRSLDEMIPERAFRSILDPYTPGLMLQMLLYDEATPIDPFFAHASNDLKTDVFSMSGVSSSISIQHENKNEAELISRQHMAPGEESTYLEEIPDIEIRQRQYRMLNEANEPELALVVFSDPGHILTAEYLKNPSRAQSYRYEHYIKVTDENWNRIAERRTSPEIHQQYYETGDQDLSVQSIFRIPNLSEDAHQVASAKLTGGEADSSRSADNVFRKDIRGLGKIEEKQRRPLTQDPDSLVMSDVILGYGESQSQDTLFPYRISADHNIPVNENLRLHIELYHLTERSANNYGFTVNYAIYPVNWLGMEKRREEKVSLTLNYETVDDAFRENIEIETSELETGDYKMDLVARDKGSGQKVEKEISFTVVPKEEANGR